MLNVQYRMHPAISHFPSLEFYGQSVFDGTIDSMGAISSRLKPPTSQHLSSNTEGHLPSVIFLDHAGDESPKDRSRVNANEAHIIASVVEDLLLKNPVCTRLSHSSLALILMITRNCKAEISGLLRPTSPRFRFWSDYLTRTLNTKHDSRKS